MSKKRIDPKLPIPLPDEPEIKPDTYQDRLRRRLDELFREFDGTLSIFDEGTYLGEADGINLVGSAVVAAQSTTLPAGIYDITVTASGGGGDTITATAVESIAAGQFVAVYNASGTPKCRIAKSSSGQGYQADGFVKDPFTVGATVTIYLPGAVNIVGGTGLTAGDVWLGTDGYATNTPPSTAGYISQQIGVAEDATKVAFEPQPDILIGTPASAAVSSTLQSQTFNSSGTFTVPTGVSAVWVDLYAGGGAGGGGNATHAGGGGGSGEYCEGFLVPVSANVTVTIGAGGTPGASGAAGGDGGNTSFGSWTVLGGKGGDSGSTGNSGAGGGVRGAGLVNVGQPGTLGTAETPSFFGGSSGGGGGGAGGGSGGILTGGSSGTGKGGGGGSTPLGAGANGGADSTNGNAATANTGGGGGGGGGTISTVGGAGGSGKCIVYWVGGVGP